MEMEAKRKSYHFRRGSGSGHEGLYIFIPERSIPLGLNLAFSSVFTKVAQGQQLISRTGNTSNVYPMSSCPTTPYQLRMHVGSCSEILSTINLPFVVWGEGKVPWINEVAMHYSIFFPLDMEGRQLLVRCKLQLQFPSVIYTFPCISTTTDWWMRSQCLYEHVRNGKIHIWC